MSWRLCVAHAIPTRDKIRDDCKMVGTEMLQMKMATIFAKPILLPAFGANLQALYNANEILSIQKNTRIKPGIPFAEA